MTEIPKPESETEAKRLAKLREMDQRVSSNPKYAGMTPADAARAMLRPAGWDFPCECARPVCVQKVSHPERKYCSGECRLASEVIRFLQRQEGKRSVDLDVVREYMEEEAW